VRQQPVPVRSGDGVENSSQNNGPNRLFSFRAATGNFRAGISAIYRRSAIR